jgi:hypothetical protein
MKLDPVTHKGNAFNFGLKTECDKSGNQSRVDRRMQAWNRLDVLKDLNYKTIFQRFSFILAFVLLILFKLLSYCWGLVPWVPRVTGYDPKFWI